VQLRNKFGTRNKSNQKIFKNTNIVIAYRARNNMKHHLGVKKNITDRFHLSGVYLLHCGQCLGRYIGQTGWTFKTRFIEHIRDIKNNGQHSKSAQHITDTGHECDTMENTMRILHMEKKGQTLNAYERLYICEARKQGLQLNDTLSEGHNAIYDTTLAAYST
jgi:hypothetical protein